MERQARASGVVHALNLPLIYNSGVNLLQEKRTEGYLGQVRQLSISMTFPRWPRRWQVNLWIGTRVQGGPVRECCPHFFHFVLREYGPITRVRAQMHYPDLPQACEIGARGLLELADGLSVSVDILCNVAQPESVEYIHYGTQGTLCLHNWDEPVGWREECGSEQFSVVALDEHTLLMDNLLNAIEGRPANLAGFHEGLAVQEVLEAWDRSSRSGQWETI
ncbi:MAG TPA: Gfo/Idh/MocA family oxidoreductase [Ktedonobacteraceae bacterium]